MGLHNKNYDKEIVNETLKEYIPKIKKIHGKELIKKIHKLPTMKMGKREGNRWYKNLTNELEELE